ncbi:carboxypeptidase regulatory-like domain-containing protein [Planctomycetota bacterium]
MRKRGGIGWIVVLLVTAGALLGATEGVMVRGTLTDTQGQSLAGAKVRLFFRTVVPESSSSEVQDVIRECITDANGCYSFTESLPKDVPYPHGLVFAQHETTAWGWAYWDMTKNQTCDIQLLRPMVLAGRVVDEKNQPIPGVEIEPWGVTLPVEGEEQPQRMYGQLDECLMGTQTNADGEFVFRQVPENARIMLIARKAGYGTLLTYNLRQQPGSESEFTAGREDVLLTLAREARLVGTVVAQDTGQPVPDVPIKISLASRSSIPDSKPIVSDAQGRFQVGGLVAGAYHLKVKDSPKDCGWVSPVVAVDLFAGETPKNQRLELTRGGLLEVLVTAEGSGHPIKQASINLRAEDGDHRLYTSTDANGLARQRLYPGSYRISGVNKPGLTRVSRISQQIVTIKNGETVRKIYTLGPEPKIEGIVRDSNGVPLPNVNIMVTPFGSRTVTSDDRGRFEIAWRRPNMSMSGREVEFLLVVQSPSQNLALGEPLDEESDSLDLTLESGLTISGRVVDSNDNPLPSATAQLMIRYGRYGSTLNGDGNAPKGDVNGHFEIRAIPRGYDCTVMVSADGYGSIQHPFHSDDFAGETGDIGSLSLAKADLSLSGKVVDVDDKPLAGIRVIGHGQGQPINLRTESGADGTFSFDKVCPGSIRIFASMSGARRLSGNVEAEGGVMDLKIVMQDRSSMAGRTVNRVVRREPKPLLQKPLPDLAQLGVTMESRDLKGKPILLCFWDVEQRPARRALLQLKKQAPVLEEKDVQVITVQSTEVPKETLNKWLRENDIPFATSAFKGNTQEAMFKWGVLAVPWLILTDKEHIVDAEGFGIRELDQKLQEVLESKK